MHAVLVFVIFINMVIKTMQSFKPAWKRKGKRQNVESTGNRQLPRRCEHKRSLIGEKHQSKPNHVGRDLGKKSTRLQTEDRENILLF